jgi:outer membrane immunogenic protein
MRKLVLAASILAASTAGAFAADLAARPYTKAPPVVAALYDWSGFYIGINGGGAWSHKCWDINNALGIAVIPAIAEGCHDATGGTVGGQIGYRWQAGTWVFGLEAQGNWADLSGSNISSPLALGPVFSNRSKIDAIGLFTGQIGYAWNNVLFYVKGGAMAVNDKYEGFFTGTNVVFDRASETRWGGAVGVGLDFGITPNLVFGVDYVHGFMGDRDITFTATPVAILSRVDRVSQDVDMVTARLSYKFGGVGGPVVARY